MSYGVNGIGDKGLPLVCLICLTATASSWNSARALHGRNSGKFYYEVKIDKGGNVFGQGIVTQDFNVGSYLGAVDGDSIGCYSSITNLYGNLPGGTKHYDCTHTQIVTNAIMMIAVDLDNSKIWFGANGSWWGSGNPVTGANPLYSGFTIGGNTYYPAVSMISGSKVTARFSSAQWSYSAPTGFGEWIQYVPLSIASCSPTPAGTITYDTTLKLYKFCNGTDWYSMKGAKGATCA